MATISWKTGSSGLWSDAADWSTGTTPTTSSAVLINAAPAISGTPYTVSLENSATVASVTLDQSLATLEVDSSTLTLGTKFTLAAGTLYLNQSTLQGGTLFSGSGTVLSYYGTLASLAVDGSLDLAAEYGSSDVTLETVTFTGSAGTGTGSLVIGSGLLAYINEASIATVDVTLASGATLSAGTSSATSFVVNSGCVISTSGSQVNGYVPQTAIELTNGGLLVNKGQITNASGADLVISATSFENTGTISVGNGSTIEISTSGATADTNTGLLSVGAGGYLELSATETDGFTSTGSVSVAGTLGLDFALTTAELAAFPVTTGTLAIEGTLTNTGGTLTTGSGTKIANLWLDGGDIVGGKIVSAGGLAALSGTLSGATIDGSLLVQTPDPYADGNPDVYVSGSLTMAGSAGTGPGSITISGGNLDFLTSTTLSNVSVNIGYETGTPAIVAGYYSESAGTTLTFAANDKITQSGDYYADLGVASAADALVNDGTITVAAADDELYAYGLTNAGLITISNGSTFGWYSNNYISYTSVVNSGTVTIDGGYLDLNHALDNSGLLSVSGTSATNPYSASLSLANTGTLSVSGNAFIALGGYGGSWSNTGTFLISAGEIDLYDSFTAAQIGKVAISNGGILGIGGTLTNTGTLAVGTGNTLSRVALLSGAEIAGGTIADAGGGLLGEGGTLSGVSYKGILNLTANTDAALTIAGGTTVAPASGSGQGTILLTGFEAYLYFQGSQTLSHDVIDFGENTVDYSYYGSRIEFSDPTFTPTTLTIAATSSIVETGEDANISGNTAQARILGDEIINDGSITETASASNLQVDAANLLNAGTITIGNGSEFDFDNATLTNKGTIAIAGSETNTDGSVQQAELSFGLEEGGYANALANAGLITVGAGGLLDLDGVSFTWSNTGTILLAGGELDLGGTFTTAQIGKVTVSGGGFISIDADGTLNNTGATLTVAGTSPLGTISLAGTIHGGTIVDHGSGLAIADGDLDSVKYDGVLNIGGLGAIATITGGISLTGTSGTGTGSISLTGIGAELDFAGTETLSNTDISIGSGSALNTVTGYVSYGSDLTGTDLTLSGDVIKQSGALATIGQSDGSSSSTITNTGQIIGNLSGDGLELAGDLVNSGTIAVSNGETLYLDTTALTNTGTISVTNGLLDVGDVTANQLTEVKLVNSTFAITGTVTATGSTITVGSGTSLPYIELEGQILGGTIKDEGGGIGFFGTSFLNGVTYEGTLSINRPDSYVVILNSFAATDLTGKLAGSISIAGAGSELAWDSSQTLNNATISIGNAAASAALVSEYYYDEPFTLGAQLTINQSGTYADIAGFGSYASSYSAPALARPDTSGLVYGPYNTVSAATINAGFSGGQLSLEGEYFTSTGKIAISNKDTVIEGAASFANAGIITIGASSTLSLDLGNYFDYGILDPESFTNSGSIALAGGSITEPLENGLYLAVPMLNATGGSMSGFGTISAEIINDGLITASGGTLSLGQEITGTGTLAVDNGATLSLAAVSSGQTATFSGTGGILGLAPASFLGEIGGFASGDTIDLASTTATAASFSGTSLVVTLSTGSTIKLTTTTALTGTLKTTAGTHGDTLITFSGAAVKGPIGSPIAPDSAAGDMRDTAGQLGAYTPSHPVHPMETWAAHLAH